jgi:AAA domain
LPRPSGLSAFAEREVAVFAPSSAATEILRADSFAAETFQMLMHNEALQAETAAKILWMDEAGFLNSRQMLWLAECAAEHNNRVILTGDPHQHHALERGDMLRILVKANAVRVAELTQIQRQTDPDLRAAVHALSTGEVGRGFEMLDEGSALLKSRTTANAILFWFKSILKRWLRDRAHWLSPLPMRRRGMLPIRFGRHRVSLAP